MLLSVITTACIIMTLSAFGGLVLMWFADNINCNNITESEYLKSKYYAETQQSFDEAMKRCNSENDFMYLISSLTPLMGIGLGVTYVVIHRKDKSSKDEVQK